MTIPDGPAGNNPYYYDDLPSAKAVADTWTPDPSWKPTGWFLATIAGQPTAAARWYWPTATLTEKWDPASGTWVTVDLFNQINRSDWDDSTQDDVEAWIGTQNSRTADDDGGR